MAQVLNVPVVGKSGQTTYYSGEGSGLQGYQSQMGAAAPAPAPASAPATPPLTGPGSLDPTAAPAPSAPTSNTPATSPTVNVNVNQPTPTVGSGQPDASGSAATGAPTTQAQSSPYTVKSGDTLGGIAKTQGTTLAEILANNPQYQQNPDLIKPGQTVNLAKKYQDFHAGMGDKTAPDANPRQQIQDATQPEQAKPDPQAQFKEAVANFNPIEKMLYDQITAATNTQSTQQTFVDQWKAMENDPALVGLKLEQMNINNVMKGTEDDIRDEITKAGGSGTESQIQAMTAARNKTLIKQANTLSSAIQQKEDYITQIMNLTQADRSEADKQVTQKLGLTKQLSDMVDKQNTAAKDNYQKIVDTIGYDGLAKSFNGNTTQMARAEKLLDLPTGSLSNPNALAALSTKTGGKSQYVSGTEYQQAGIFDPNTNTFTPLSGGGKPGGSNGSVPLNPAYSGAISTILGSGKFTKAQAAQITNSINQGEDPFTVIKNNAKNIMGQTEATKLTSYEAADSAMRDLQKNINAYYDAGGDTGLLSGTFENVANKLGQVKDPNKVAIATQVAVSLQAYRNAISGTAYSNQEGQQINSIFPGINKSHGLNDAIIKGRLTADQSLIDGIYKTALGAKTYDALKAADKASQPVTVESLKADMPTGQLLVSRETPTGRQYAYIKPDELWATDIKL